VLSLSQRRATLEAFTSRRFDVAAVRAGQVLEAAAASGYLDEHDVTSVRKAWLLAERSRHWMELRYDHPLLQDHPLHRLFVTSREQQRPPRAIVEGLRDPGSTQKSIRRARAQMCCSFGSPDRARPQV
jgi:hypothetical protein